MNRDQPSRYLCQTMRDNMKRVIPLLNCPAELKTELFMSKIQVELTRLCLLFVFNFVDVPLVDAAAFIALLKTLRYSEQYDTLFLQDSIDATPVFILFAPLEQALQLMGIEEKLRALQMLRNEL